MTKLKSFLGTFVIAILLISTISNISYAQNANSTRVQFPLFTNTEVLQTDAAGNYLYNPLAYLQNLPYISISETITGGAANSNVNEYIINLPVDVKILQAKFILTTVQVGAANNPDLFLLAGTDTVGIYDSVALGGTIGDIETLTLTSANVDVDSGTNLILRVNTPSGATVSTAIKGKLQVVWKPRK